MKLKTMQNAIMGLLVISGLTVAVQPALAGDIAVIRIKAVDGLYVPGTEVSVTQDTKFMASANVRVARSAVSSLDGVKTLVLVERRSDAKAGDKLNQTVTNEVMALNGDTFTLKGVDGKSLTYSVDVLSDGSVDLIGPKDSIKARSGGVYQIWKIESTSLMSSDRITLY